ncbi:MAG: oligosaccharide flippase family protein, partial [Bacteroidota bacterium]
MSLYRKLASETAIYGLSSVAGRLLNYLLVPLYTAFFQPAEYGIVTELYAFVAFLNILYVYGMETAFFRFSSAASNQYFSTAVFSILFSSLFFSGFLFALSDTLAALMSYSGKGHFIRWLAIILMLDAIVAIPFARLRQLGKAKRFALLRLLNIAINIGCNLFFIVFCPWLLQNSGQGVVLDYIYDPSIGVGYVFLSNLIANGCYLPLMLKEWREVQFKWKKKEFKEMFAYAWPVLIIGFAGITNEMLSRVLLKYRLHEGFY